MTDSIERTLELAAPIEAVWNALTDPKEIALWFSDATDLEPHADAEGSFTWTKYGSHAARVEVFEPMKRLVWRWAEDPELPLSQAHSTVVEWTLERQGDGTVLHLRESGFSTAEHHEQNVRGWNVELEELRRHIEG